MIWVILLSVSDWDRFLVEAVSLNTETNFKLPFSKLCSKYGKVYREYIKLAYSIKDDLSDELFCYLNHLPDNLLFKWI